MTDSRPIYKEVAFTRQPLYRYVDGGVAQHLEQTTCDLVILFVPGHGGDFRQGRSLGVEILLAAFAAKVKVHVYTLSNDGAFSAFDGSLLEEQAVRVAGAAADISRHYMAEPRPGLVVVAHSMGGVAALDALRMLATARDATPPLAVDAVILFSVPLQRPVIACSDSLAHLYRRVHRFLTADDGNAWPPVLASIWGGCRDWSVPEVLSSLEPMRLSANFSALSMPSRSLPQVSTPTDHLSILWCRQLVRVSARAIAHVAALRADETSLPLAQRRVAALRAAFLDSGPMGSQAAAGKKAIAATWIHDDGAWLTLRLYALPLRTLLDVTYVTLFGMLSIPVLDIASARYAAVPTHALSTLVGAAVGLAVHAITVACRRVPLSNGYDSAIDDEGPAAVALPSLPWPHFAWALGARLLSSILLCALLHLGSRLAGMVPPLILWGRQRPAAALMAAAVGSMLTHPAVGLLVAVVSGADPSTSRLGLCGILSLLPSFASWIRAGGVSRGAAVSYSHDAQVALGHSLLFLGACGCNTMTYGGRPRAADGSTTCMRLGAAIGVVLCAGCDTWAGEDAIRLHDGASAEAVLRTAALGAVILSL